MHDGTAVVTNGNATFVPGDSIRQDFMKFQLDHDHFEQWLASVGNGT